MNNTIICAIVGVMLASTAVVAKPHNNHPKGQTREQYCRQLVGPEKGEGEAGKTATMRSQIMRWDDCMMQRSPKSLKAFALDSGRSPAKSRRNAPRLRVCWLHALPAYG